MEIDLTGALFPRPELPAGFSLIPWEEGLLDAHAEVKFRSFRTEIDANVFPCLGDRDGCRRLMDEISHRSGFVPEATWLAQYWPGNRPKPEVCGTIQGIMDVGGVGAVQNVGVTPAHRGFGLGTCLLYESLAGFQQVGVKRVYLEVTAQNVGAVRLYQRLGFHKMKTVYKASEVAYA
jgi:ribosomal protein S18 acetylase RimI-like enzyme